MTLCTHTLPPWANLPKTRAMLANWLPTALADLAGDYLWPLNTLPDEIDVMYRLGIGEAYDTSGTSLTIAAAYGHVEIARSLLHHGEEWIDAALLRAAKHGHARIVRLLLDSGRLFRYGPVSVSTLNEALDRACASESAKVVKLLIRRGAQRCGRFGYSARDHLNADGSVRSYDSM